MLLKVGIWILKTKLGKKERFLAARGWSLAYQRYCIDLTHQSQPLDPALKAPGASDPATIRLLDKDLKWNYRQQFNSLKNKKPLHF